MDPSPPSTFSNDPAQLQDIEFIFGNLVSLVLVIALIAVVLMIVIGGFKYIFASGDPKGVADARNTLTWAFIGLTMVVIAWFILLLIQEIMGSQIFPITNFRIDVPAI